MSKWVNEYMRRLAVAPVATGSSTCIESTLQIHPFFKKQSQYTAGLKYHKLFNNKVLQ
jgi:hypothetical protein